MPVSIAYALTVLIWGLTWTAIHVQVAHVVVDLSVFYRFVCAAAIALVSLKAGRSSATPGLATASAGWCCRD